jgi:hypothetical protein
MALNYKSGSETQSAITANTNGATIDLIGYKEIAISVIFGTCTGQASNVGTLKIQTSNDNSNWHALTPTLASEDDHTDLSGTTSFQYLPDNSTTDEHGFGRYVRFVFAASNYTGGSVTYTVKWLAKE